MLSSFILGEGRKALRPGGSIGMILPYLTMKGPILRRHIVRSIALTGMKA